MGYWGAVVLTRSETCAARLPGVTAIGYKHTHLRFLGDGWQLLETFTWDGPTNLVDAAGRLSAQWDAPILVSWISDSSCAQVHWAVPGQPVGSAHLPESRSGTCGYLHRPRVSGPRDPAAITAEVTEWAESAGLAVSPRRLARVMSHMNHQSDAHVSAADLAFELIRAVGFPVLARREPYVFNPHEGLIGAVTSDITGAGKTARGLVNQRVGRAAGTFPLDVEPKADWEDLAIQLEEDIWASVYGGYLGRDELVARALEVQARYRVAYADDRYVSQSNIETADVESSPGHLASLEADEERRLNLWDTESRTPGVWPELA